VVWRADLADGTPECWVDTISLCPPVVGETLPLRIHAVRSWLAGEVERDDSGDLEGEPGVEDKSPVSSRPFVRWRGAELSTVCVDPRDVAPGDTIVVPTSRGGCDEFGWVPAATTPVTDLADEARAVARRAPALRMHPSCIPEDAPRATRDLCERSFDDGLPDDIRELVKHALKGLSVLDRPVGAIAASLEGTRCRVEAHPSGRGLVVTRSVARDFTDEDATSSAGPARVGLVEHLDQVRGLASQFADAVGLPSDVAEDVTLAAALHDLGKTDPRFQAWLRGGNLVAALRESSPLAKSERMPACAKTRDAARERAGYPKGGRHELLSTRLAESAPALLAGVHDRDLVLHLIESHHGHCRAFAPVVADPKPVDVAFDFHGHVLTSSTATALERVDSGVAQRFFTLLRRYGHWGLSYLEACLRLADHRASEAPADERAS
jgi:CRISPR-associated endonuclease/helicase Cas3